MITKHRKILRFTLVEMALALAVLGVGLSAVLLLSTLGAKADKDGRVERSLEDVVGRMTVFLQTRFADPGNWREDGSSSAAIPSVTIPFDPSPADSDVPVGMSDEFSPVSGQIGIFSKDAGTYICATDVFEAMVRVGTDNTFWDNQFYRSTADGTVKKLTVYPTTPTIPPSPADTRIRGANTAEMFGKFCRPLIVEFSWPINVEWSKREKRIMRLDLFNENFIPYPQS